MCGVVDRRCVRRGVVPRAERRGRDAPGVDGAVAPAKRRRNPETAEGAHHRKARRAGPGPNRKRRKRPR